MLTILLGDAWEKLLLEFPSESVQCCVTSPPYWGLRDYGTATWEGGDEGCEHKKTDGDRTDRPWGLLHPANQERHQNKEPNYKTICGKCGAKRIDSQIGLEETPEQYVTKMVEVFREVRRVLKKDGTLWMNLGDSYANGLGGPPSLSSTLNGGRGVGPNEKLAQLKPLRKGTAQGLKPKDLCGIPWRVAFALQSDGWYLRSDIIWSKPNPMPESVTDRPTKAHEYLFLLSKNERYYYDAEAIREPHSEPWRGQGEHESSTPHSGRLDDPNKEQAAFTVAVRKYNPDGRNKRSVWTVPTEPYAEAHFATFPPDLIKPCILAGTKPGDLVLDPFAGSGTTGAVALELGRKAILIELNPVYIPLIKKRCTITPGFQFMNPNDEPKLPEIAQFHEIL
jgi:DNA modification methylase